MTHPYLYSVLKKDAQIKVHAFYKGFFQSFRLLKSSLKRYKIHASNNIRYTKLCCSIEVFVERVFEVVYESIKANDSAYQLFKIDALDYYKNDFLSFKKCVKSDRNVRMIADLKHLICWILRTFAYIPYSKIANEVGRNNHSTVIHGINKVNEILLCPNDRIYNFFLLTIERIKLHLVGLFDNEGKADGLLNICIKRYDSVKTTLSALFPYCNSSVVLNQTLIDLGIVDENMLSLIGGRVEKPTLQEIKIIKTLKSLLND